MSKVSKLNTIVEAALNSPLYKWRFKNSSLVPQSFEEFPITVKKQLYEGYEQHVLHPDLSINYKQSIYISPSGGTRSGDTANMYVNIADLQENEQQRQSFASFVSKYNVINSSMIFGNLFGTASMYRSLDVTTSLIERCNATNLCIERTCSNELAYKFMKRFSANGITSSPSRILYFIEFLDKNNITDLYLPHLFYAGETLHQKKLEIMKNKLKSNNILSVYGSAESGVWAVQNETVFGDNYFYYDPNEMYVEIDDNTNEIILTSLLKFRYPLIKYNTNDCGRIVEVTDNIGVLEIFGRNELSFSVGNEYNDITQDGELCRFLNQFISYQIVINTDSDGFDNVCFLLVNNDDTINKFECENKLKKLVKGDPGEKAVGIECKFCDVSELQISAISGKIKPIVDLRK